MATDFELIDAVLEGHCDKFEELVRAYHSKVIALCRSMLKNADDAEDAAQEVFIKVFKALKSFDKKAKFSTWLYSICYRHCIDKIRKVKRLREQSQETILEKDWTPVADSYHQLERKDIVERLLHSLPDTYRQILILREVHGLSYKELTEILECSVDAVKSHLKRARHQMKQNANAFLSLNAILKL